MFYDNIHSEPMDFAAWPLSPKGALRVPKSASPTPSPGLTHRYALVERARCFAERPELK